VTSQETTAWLAAFGAAHHGIVSLAAALRAGITREALRHRLAAGLLIRMAAGVYRLRDHPWTWEARLWAALLEAEPLAAYVSHRSAGRLHGLWVYRDANMIEITGRRGRDHDTTLSRFHSTSLLDADHVTVVQGIPCTTLARTIFDLCGDPDRRPLRSEAARATHRLKMLKVANDAIRHHGLQIERELAVLAAIGKRGRPGTALTRELFAEMGCRYVPTESDLETVFLELCRTAQLPLPEKQVSISDPEGFIGRVDFLFEPNVIVEIDSSWHDGPLDKQRDAVRDDRLRGLGYVVRRWRWSDLVLTPEKLLRRLREDLKRSEPGGTSGAIAPEVTAH
jgi:Transcriptional regulator, AbiEi antitoxin/Protein of unknown function (DUF559)